MPLLCRMGKHRMVTLTAVKAGATLKRTMRCRRCGLAGYVETPFAGAR